MKELTSLLELLGEAATLVLIEHYGGTRLSVPRQLPDEHALRGELGAQAPRLIEYFGGSEIQVPLARAWRARIYHGQKLTYREIARKLGCTEATVYWHLKKKDVQGPETQGMLTFS